MDALRLVFGLATENASRAISRWTQGGLVLSLDDVCEATLEEAIARLGVGDQPAVMAVLSIEGDLPGDILLTFGERDARQLCADLTGLPANRDEPWSDIEESAIAETGNILGSAYLNALTPVVGKQMTPSPPALIHDFGCSVVEQLLMTQAMISETVFVSRTTFQRRNALETIDGDVLVIPSLELKDAMQQAVVG
jgi:chemotaxis protein CheC